MGLKKPNQTSFKKGHIPWNKGKKGVYSEEVLKRWSMKRKGRKFTEEWRRKLSESRSGDKNPAKKLEVRKKISQTLQGRKCPQLSGDKNPAKRLEVRQKISEIRKGEKNPAWKGGITPIYERLRHNMQYKIWRKTVLERDNFICQKCGQKGGNLRTHHINNFAEFPELKYAIDNGITLCENCHKEFHKRYGIKNNTKEQLEEFLKRS